MRRVATVMAVLMLAACGSNGGSEKAEDVATTAVATTTEAPTTTTTTEAPTTTTTTAPTFPFTVTAWTTQWNVVLSTLIDITSGGEQLQTFSPDEAGQNLYGSVVSPDAAVFVEASERGKPINSAIVAIRPGSNTAARVISAAGASLVDGPMQGDVLAAFNDRVVPKLSVLSDYETKIEVTDDLDLLIYVANADPLELVFVWTPAGVAPSDEALAARYPG